MNKYNISIVYQEEFNPFNYKLLGEMEVEAENVREATKKVSDSLHCEAIIPYKELSKDEKKECGYDYD